MFNISHNLNKKAEISVIFVDNNFKFLNQLNFFSKNQLKQINLFKNDFAELDLLKLDLLDNDKKQKIVIYKIKDDLNEYDFQKAGGLVYAKISKFKSANIFFDTDLSIDNYKYKFFSNFLLGLMSRSYNFKNYKFKKDNSKNILQSLSILSSDKATLQKSIRYAQNIYSGIEETRNLVTLPANILNPKKFVDEILKLKKLVFQ